MFIEWQRVTGVHNRGTNRSHCVLGRPVCVLRVLRRSPCHLCLSLLTSAWEGSNSHCVVKDTCHSHFDALWVLKLFPSRPAVCTNSLSLPPPLRPRQCSVSCFCFESPQCTCATAPCYLHTIEDILLHCWLADCGTIIHDKLIVPYLTFCCCCSFFVTVFTKASIRQTFWATWVYCILSRCTFWNCFF
jgi:hypothetical protein